MSAIYSHSSFSLLFISDWKVRRIWHTDFLYINLIQFGHSWWCIICCDCSSQTVPNVSNARDTHSAYARKNSWKNEESFRNPPLAYSGKFFRKQKLSWYPPPHLSFDYLPTNHACFWRPFAFLNKNFLMPPPPIYPLIICHSIYPSIIRHSIRRKTEVRYAFNRYTDFHWEKKQNYSKHQGPLKSILADFGRSSLVLFRKTTDLT